MHPQVAKEMSGVKNDFFRENGFLIARNLLSEEEVEALRKRADEIARDIESYHGRDQAERKRLGELYAPREVGTPRNFTFPDVKDLPEIKLSDTHACRGKRIYPLRQRPVDRAAIEAGNASDDPFSHSTSGMFGGSSGGIDTVNHPTDNDELYRSVAAHPKILEVVHEILGPNLKVWFDRVLNKPPYNDVPIYHGSNRFHQDGFFQMSKRSVSCWLALDEVTLDNGCMRFIPLSTGYGQFRIDQLGDVIGEKELEQEVLAPLKPGDATFHDRWTVHGTGPNETPHRRRALAMHYADTESKFGDYANDPGFTHTYYSSPDRVHVRDGGAVHGNRKYKLVSGREFPGCI